MEEVLMGLRSTLMGIETEAIGTYKQIFEKKISFFKYLCEVLLRNSGVSQCNYHYTITV